MPTEYERKSLAHIREKAGLRHSCATGWLFHHRSADNLGRVTGAATTSRSLLAREDAEENQGKCECGGRVGEPITGPSIDRMGPSGWDIGKHDRVCGLEVILAG